MDQSAEPIMPPPPPCTIKGVHRSQMDEYVMGYALEHGYKISVKRSWNDRLECSYKCSAKVSKTAEDDSTSKQDPCPFALFAAYDEKAGEWYMSHVNTDHNHPPVPPSKIKRRPRDPKKSKAKPTIIGEPGRSPSSLTNAVPPVASFPVPNPTLHASAPLATTSAPGPTVEETQPTRTAADQSSLSPAIFARAKKLQALPAAFQRDILKEVDALIELFSSKVDDSPFITKVCPFISSTRPLSFNL